MYMKKVLILATCVLAFAACNKTPQGSPVTPSETGKDYTIRITPVMTKATETSFENGDAIGLTVSRASGAFDTNEKLTYKGLEFSSKLRW